MSKDIRSFFKVASAKKNDAPSRSSQSVSKRKANSLNDSDDEKESQKKADQKKQRRIIDSDEEDEIPKKVKESSSKSSSQAKPATQAKEKKKLVEVDLSSMFGSEPVKRKERPKVVKPPPTVISDVIDLDDDDDLDISMIEEMEKLQATEKQSSPTTNGKSSSKSPEKKQPKLEMKSPAMSLKQSTPKKNLSPEDVKLESPSPAHKKVKPPTSSSKKEKKVKESSAEDDEARHEKRQAAAALYHQFKNRSGVLNHVGCKEIPEGKPNCLKGLQFVISGTLESMLREEAADLIKSCGGNVVTGLSKKVTHMLVGEEAGPAKLAKAEEMKIAQISEDELLSLIRRKSGLPEPAAVSDEAEVVIKDSPGKENRKTNQDPEVKTEPTKSPAPAEKQEKKTQAVPTVAQQPKATPTPRNMDDLSFVDKYKPTSMKQIIGQQGSSGSAQKLWNWLLKWQSGHDGKKKPARPNPWAKDNDGSAYKCALLSGPPGVGKTTTAHLVCNELMFDIVEFNASDTRSKKLLKEEVSSLLSNQSLAGYLNGSETKTSKRHVLIMDEVDGMAGNEDRGGIAELIGLIKESHIPVICMCNDRSHPKIRALANHCFDLRFSRPSVATIRGAMMTICFKEGIKLEAGAIDEIIGGTGSDIRQTLNHLAMYSASKGTKLALDDAKKNAQSSEKDTKIGNFEVVRKVFSAEEHKKMSFNDKSDLFFNDYNIAPLFVQDNYLRVKPKCDKSEVLKRIAMTADSLSLGDLVEKRIRSNQAWSLLPTQAVFSSVLPGEYMSGTIAHQIGFPAWLGKNSRANKRKRLAQEVHDHTRMSTSGSRLSVRLDYAPFLIQAIVKPLKDLGVEGVPKALEIIKEYRLLREDIDALLELTTWPKIQSPWESIDSKVKAALTRAYNKEVQPYSYSVQAGVKKKAAKAAESEVDEFGTEEEEAPPASDEEEEDDSLENNALIKVKKPKETKPGSSDKAGPSSSKAGSSSSKASTSKSSKPKSKK